MPGTVPRPRLTRRLASAKSLPLILVSAPAGYGKTTLLREWAANDERPFAWLTLGAEDNDPAVFLDAVADGLERVGTIEAGVVPALQARGGARRRSVWAAV